jgi:small redox-active disulfide protein 2
MDIKILGPGCKNCILLYKITSQVVQELGLNATIEKIEDYGQIASYGVMSTPAFVLDGVVAFSGRVPTPSNLKEIILTAQK